jgi:glycine oxidase
MRISVHGAGIVGLACADELRRRGHEVCITDPSPGMGASHAAAGMLSPSTEAWWDDAALLDLGTRSLALWPEFAARLGVGLTASGTVLAARDHGDLQQVERQLQLLAAHGHRVDLLSGKEVTALEPALTVRVAGGAFLPDDHSVDPRAVVAALLARVPQASAQQPAGEDVDVTILATGSTLPEPWSHLIRGVRGEIVRARLSMGRPARTIRGWVRGEPVYVVSRPNGEIVIGATSEEHDGAPIVTVGGVGRLVEAARELVPALDRAEFVEAIARHRPASPDHLPLIGPAPSAGPGASTWGGSAILATGLYRHGVLLAPLTAQLVADCVETGATEPSVDPRRIHAAPRSGAIA